ncbi:hypothetical protein PLICRDRAFT_37127 [Plicaturopsis crispa FD-325 SS-3]|nr:hypothetical protein PLICRDRAFT_37127 [Plicaturopsis crispa FD-325 SS-3]
MASAAGRKKSIISSSIDTPVANNTLLNKAASQSTSLYQQCSSLRARLLRIHGFAPFFAIASGSGDSRQSTDPVTQLWDVFALGVPLCYIYNLLPPPATPISTDTDPATFNVDNERQKKRAIALFAMQIRQLPGCEPFTVTDLWDRNSTDGLVKVINTITTLVNRLPQDRFEESPPTPPLTAHGSQDSLIPDSIPAPAPMQGKETARNNIIREMVETERKYVADLETMQRYSKDLSQSNTIDQDTIHLLFPNLNKLLNFQRKFLIRLESTAEMPWKDQRWGMHFIENEDDFAVYEPYCANYTAASELMIVEEQNLLTQSQFLNAKTELPAFLIKPVQRICKYPLLLDSLIKASSPESYPHFEELKAGSAAAKRITDKINEAQRRAENRQTVQNLQGRISDWKGHHLSNFGDLMLDDVFVVMKSDVDREYHVFLFEKIILCCKEAIVAPNASKKINKNNSILKKQSPPPLSLPGGGGPSKKKDTPLLLKGRIFLNNVTQAVQATSKNAAAGSSPYSLEVWWRGDDDLEYFTLRCRTEEQLKQWQSQINRLIKQAEARRASGRGMSRVASQAINSTNPALQSVYSRPSLMTPPPSYISGPPGYPPQNAFDFDADDDLEDYPPVNNYPTSGRGTPVGSRRGTSQSMPPERDAIPGYDRPRARTEDAGGPVMAQWRTNGAIPPPPPPTYANGGPAGAMRPTTPRLTSTASSSSYTSTTSDSSYGPPGGKPPSRPPAAGLRSQFSSTKLKSVYSEDESSRSNTPAPPPPVNGYPNGIHHQPSRSRSASQPSSYIPKTAPPPMPTTPWSNRPSGDKRGSGSSQSTGESSDYSPNSSSPVTPFGSSESSLGISNPRASRAQHYDGAAQSAQANTQFAPAVKVKVHFHEDIFVIQVPRSTEFAALVERVGKKIRLCGPRRDDGPLRVKYRDEDGDLVSLGSTEDVQMAFEQFRPGGQVTLYVQ